MSEDISEACGVFGAISTSDQDVFPLIYWGLLSLNHRGQQSYGFTTLKKGVFHKKEDLNLVPTDPREVGKLSSALHGSVGIANARYATSGGRGTRHLQGGKQPLVVSTGGRRIAVSYNGNIVNASKLRAELRRVFGKFRTDADTEVLARQLLFALEENGGEYSKAVGNVLDSVEGAYSAMVLDSDGSLHAFRDVNGIRPYCFGKKKGVYAFASETPALDINGFLEIGFVNPGELISVSRKDKFIRRTIRRAKHAMCSFEFAYFSRPDSVLNGTNRPVYKIREEFAKALARTYSNRLQNDDLIISMPETADDAAYGLHEATGLPWERAVRKNRYVTRRAFISRSKERDSVIDKKVNIVPSLVRGKRLAVIEDSIVRGETSKINIAKLNRAGARSVDLFVTFPRITDPCLYGVDMATHGELLGSKMDERQIATWLDATSVNFQSIGGLVEAIGIPRERLCLGCITGQYPTPTAQKLADANRKDYRKTSSGRRIYEGESRATN
ncbi:MAG: amidophosphoribosyltransferase [Nitrososphaerales archaeon]